MDELEECISQIRERLKKFRTLYEENEMAVREQIINPILRQLGWNPEDPEYVQPNVTMGDGVPDYTLMVEGKPFLFIEAKKLSVDIKDKAPIRQLSRYSVEKGTSYGILTNGYTWLLLRTFEEGKEIGERTIWEIDIENDEFPTLRRKIGYISRQKIRELETLVEKSHVIDDIWNQYVLTNPSLLTSALIGIIKEKIAEVYGNLSFDESEIRDLLDEKVFGLMQEENDLQHDQIEEESEFGSHYITPYSKMSLGTQSFSFQNAFEILVNTANWLIKQGKLHKSDCPVNISRGKRYLINTIPKHRYGEPFRAPRNLSNGLFIESHASTVSIIDYSERLLEKFGCPKDTLKLMH